MSRPVISRRYAFTSSEVIDWRLPVVVEVLEELVPGQVLAALDDPREARVPDRDVVLDAALAAEAEAHACCR